MATLKVSDLSPHPKNNYYFDDVSGDKWNEFLESIRKNGVREQIIVTDDMVIVSGHQRVRACKELGIQVIDAKIEHYNSDDDVVRDLIEINTKQRGVISDSEIKIGRRIKFLEEYYGVKNGNNQHTRASELSSDPHQKTQSDLAEDFNMSTRQLRKYKSLTDLIPELQEAVESGQITATTAMGFVKKLSPEEQKKLAESISGQDKVSGKEVEKYIVELKAKDAEIERLTRNYEGLDRANKILAKEANQGGKVVEKVVEVAVVPDDYEETKRQLQMYRGDNERLNRENKEKVAELSKANEMLRELQSPDGEKKVVQSAQESMDNFSIATYDYIRRYGGNVWSFDKWADVPESTRKNFAKAIQMLSAFAQQMADNVGGLE